MSQLELVSEAMPVSQKREGRSSGWIGNLLFQLYRVPSGRFRELVRSTVNALEGSEYHSLTLRRIFAHYHQVTVGLYTHGGCFTPGQMRPNTVVGRYSSIAHGGSAHINHPMNLKSSHAFFYKPELGYVKKDVQPKPPLIIGNDVWFGKLAVIMPSVSHIGDGAIIGAGAVVNKDVPPYAVVVGNPGRVVRFRFSQKIIDELLESRWWDRSIEELLPELDSFQTPLDGAPVR